MYHLVVIAIGDHLLGHADLVGRKATDVLQGVHRVDKIPGNDGILGRGTLAPLGEDGLVLTKLLDHGSSFRAAAMCDHCHGRAPRQYRREGRSASAPAPSIPALLRSRSDLAKGSYDSAVRAAPDLRAAADAPPASFVAPSP